MKMIRKKRRMWKFYTTTNTRAKLDFDQYQDYMDFQ